MPGMGNSMSVPLAQLAQAMGPLHQYLIPAENVKMQAVIRQQRPAAHEAHWKGPPHVKPGPLRKLLKMVMGVTLFLSRQS